jgi:hypothetical protein
VNHHEHVWETRGTAPPFLPPALDDGEWKASCPGRFISQYPLYRLGVPLRIEPRHYFSNDKYEPYLDPIEPFEASFFSGLYLPLFWRTILCEFNHTVITYHLPRTTYFLHTLHINPRKEHENMPINSLQRYHVVYVAYHSLCCWKVFPWQPIVL